MEGVQNVREDCDRVSAVGDGSFGSHGNRMPLPVQGRGGEGVGGTPLETKSTVCDRGGMPEAHTAPREVPRNLCVTPSASYVPGIAGNASVVAGVGGGHRVMDANDRRASLELRCLGLPVRRPAVSGLPSGLVISKVNPGSGASSSRQEIPVKDISCVSTNVQHHNSEERTGGCDLTAVNKERQTFPSPGSRGPPLDVPVRSPTNHHPIGSHNGPLPMAHAATLGDGGGAVAPVSQGGDGRLAAGLSPPLTGRTSVGDGIIISRSASNAIEPVSMPMAPPGHELLSPSRRNGDVERLDRPKVVPTSPVARRDGFSPPQNSSRAAVREDSGILGRMLGHSILGNGEITLTPRSHPQRPQGVKRGPEGPLGGDEKRAMLDTVSLMEQGHLSAEFNGPPPSGLSIEVRSPKGVSGNSLPSSNGFKMKEIRSERDEITIEPIMDPNRINLGMRREQQAGVETQARVPENLAHRYPLLREGLSKPCLRRRGRPPKAALQAVGRARRYGTRPMEYAAYHTALPQLPSGLGLPQGTVVNPLVSQQPRKSMSVDEVLSYYGSMQERKALGSDAEAQRPQPSRGETSMPPNPETPVPAMQNSSLAQIESLVQSQVPSSTGFFPSHPTSMPRYPYPVPNPPPSIPVVPGYSPQLDHYTSQQMLMQDGMAGYYGMRYRGRGRPRGRTRARGRPRGNSGLYFHGTERDILPKPDYMPRHSEDVEEIVVEVDFKPEWEDEREAEGVREDSLSEAQKLVPNWISVVPAKMPQGRRSASQKDGEPGRVGSSASSAAEVASWGGKSSAPAAPQPQMESPEKLEICPSVEDVLGQSKQEVTPERSTAVEPKPAETTPPAAQSADYTQRDAEKEPWSPGADIEELAKTVSESSGGDERPTEEEIPEVSIVDEVDISKGGHTDASVAEDNVEPETVDLEQEKDISPPVENFMEPEVHIKTEVEDEAEGVAGKVIEKRRRSLREKRDKFKELASNLASIKSLPKDVTVVRSRVKGSSFDSSGRRSSFPKSVAEHLGPSIEIRRVGSAKAAVREAEGRAPEVMAAEGEVAEAELGTEEDDLLTRIPELSKIMSAQSAAMHDNREEEEDGMGEVKLEPESDDYGRGGEEVTEEEREDDMEGKDETYRPTGYRGTGRRGRGRRGSSTRVDAAQKPRRKRTGRAKRARVKVEEEDRPGDWEVFVCDLCGRSFSKRFRLAHHIRAYHPRPCEDGEGGAGAGRARRVFPCQQCPKAFTRKANLKKHLRIHTGEKPFVCEECGRAFTFSKNLAQHRRVHGMERPFVCEVCGHAFRFSKNLSQHRGVHAHLKPHVCSVCGRGFTRSTHLSQHKRLHSGEKPFRCSVCGKRFAQRGHAALHTRIHTGERPYACPVCGRAFSLRAHLVRHVALHQRDGEMGPGRPPPLPRRDRRGHDGVELVGGEEELGALGEGMLGGGTLGGPAEEEQHQLEAAAYLEGYGGEEEDEFEGPLEDLSEGPSGPLGALPEDDGTPEEQLEQEEMMV